MVIVKEDNKWLFQQNDVATALVGFNFTVEPPHCWKSYFLPSLIITMMVDARCDANSCLTDFTKEVRCLMFSLILKDQSAVTLLLSDARVF